MLARVAPGKQTAGKLADSLEVADIKAEQISKVVVTHAHPDHIWGLIDELDDSLRFPRAQYVVAARKFDFWTMGEVVRFTGPVEAIAAGARRVLRRIELRSTRIRPGDEVAPGIVAVDTAGHTPGQHPVADTSGSDKLLITADAFQNAQSRAPIRTGTLGRTWTVTGRPRVAVRCSIWRRPTKCEFFATTSLSLVWDGWNARVSFYMADRV